MPKIDKERPMQNDVVLYQLSFENQKHTATGNKRVNAAMLNLITRLTVMMEAYRRCKTRARYRSKVIAVMVMKDCNARETPTGYNMAPVIQNKERL